MIPYGSEIFNTDGVFPYANCMYRLSKISGEYCRDITDQELGKCKKDCIVIKGADSKN